MAGCGIRETEIALYLDVDPKTLRKYYRKELDVGHVSANVNVAKTLYKKALEGNVPAMIFWLKARAGWREKHDVDLTNSDGTLTPADASVVVNIVAPEGFTDLNEGPAPEGE